MAEIVEQNPGSGEIQSPFVAGLSSGLHVLSKILNLETAKAQGMSLDPVPIGKEDKNRIYEAPFGYKLWLKSPAVVVKKNGTTITQVAVPYTIDYLGGSITFQVPLQDSDKVTVDVTYIKPTSVRLSSIENNVATNTKNINSYKGFFSDQKTLTAKVPKGKDGDFAIVASPSFAVYTWDSSESVWKNTQSIENLSNYYDKTAVDKLVNAKENKINPGSSNKQFYAGDKTWRDLQPDVRNTILAGLSESVSGKVTASDTILSAIGKLQRQASDKKSYLSGTGAPAASLAADIGQRYVNTSNGDWFTCTASSGSSYTWKKGLNEQAGMRLYPSDKPVTDNNFTNAYKQKLDSLKNYDDSGVKKLISDKVDKVPGKQLSQNDFTNAYKQKVDKQVSSVNRITPDIQGNVALTPASIGALGKSEKATSAGNADKLAGQNPSYYEKADDVKEFSATFARTGWTGGNGTWTQTVTCSGMRESYNTEGFTIRTTSNKGDSDAMLEVGRILSEGYIVTLNGQIRATVYEQPLAGVTIYMRRSVIE